MTQFLVSALRLNRDALRDLSPIVLVIAFFQIVVLRQPFPDLVSVLIGLFCVILGLTLFIQGLESGLFPLGEGARAGLRAEGQCCHSARLWLLLGFLARR